MQETRVRSLGQEDPLEKEMATHSSILVWKIPWTEEPGRLQSMGSQRVRHDWATSLSLHSHFPPLKTLIHNCVLEFGKCPKWTMWSYKGGTPCSGWDHSSLGSGPPGFSLGSCRRMWSTGPRKSPCLSWGLNLFLSPRDCMRIKSYIALIQALSHSDSLRPHGLQNARLLCPSLSPRVYSNSCPLSQWHYPTISSFVTPFSSCPQSLTASGSFPMSWLFTSGGQSIGASVSASVLPMNIQGWFLLGLTCLISLLFNGLSRVFSSTTVWKHQFFGTQLSLWSNSHIHTWLLEKP